MEEQTRSQKGLEFTLKLRDQMSKNIKQITSSLEAMEEVMQNMGGESQDTSKKMQDSFFSVSSTLKNFLSNSKDLVKIFGSKKEKDKKDLVNCQEDTRKTMADLREEFEDKATPALGKFQTLLGNISEGFFAQIGILFSLTKALSEFRRSADLVQESIIGLNRRIFLSGEQWELLRGQFGKSTIALLSSTDKMNEVFSQISIVQMRAIEDIDKFIQATYLLSETTELSASEAGNAMRIYALWYKSSQVGMVELANAIRYVATNTKLSANEANELLNSFVSVSRNLSKEVRGKIAPQVLALGAVFREVEAPVQDLSRMFEGLTTKYSMSQRKMVLFFSQMTQTSLGEINQMIENADFLKLNELFMKSVEEMSEEQFLLMRDSFEEVTGLSWEAARAFRQMSKEQKDNYQDMIANVMNSSKRTKELTDAFKAVLSSIQAIGNAILGIFTVSFAALGEHLRKVFIEIAHKYVIPTLQAIANWIQNLSPATKEIIAMTFQITALAMAFVSLKTVITAIVPLIFPFLKILILASAKYILLGIAITLLIEGFKRLSQWFAKLSPMSRWIIGITVLIVAWASSFFLLGGALGTGIKLMTLFLLSMSPLLVKIVLIGGAMWLLVKGISALYRFVKELNFVLKPLERLGNILESIAQFLVSIPLFIDRAISTIRRFKESPMEMLGKTAGWFWDIFKGLFGGEKKSSGFAPSSTKLKGAASGAVVMGKTPIIVGEENKPEVVLPLDRINDVLDKTLSLADRKKMAEVTAKHKEERAKPVSVNVDVSNVVNVLNKILEELQTNQRILLQREHIDPRLCNWMV